MQTEEVVDRPSDTPLDRAPVLSRSQLLVGGCVLGALIAWLAYELVVTAPVRRAVRTCSELFTVANRTDLQAEERLAQARALCSRRYLETHRLAIAAEGQGLVGIPRNLNKNFQAWRQGPNVWICPTDRVGPVYQFVLEDGAWRFDGPVGLLRARGEFIPMKDVPVEEEATAPVTGPAAASHPGA
ncbi:MAG: hypothetical protein ACYC61_24005 [Isosphaeraceae bacterium]